jgi:hypothetical protein
LAVGRRGWTSRRETREWESAREKEMQGKSGLVGRSRDLSEEVHMDDDRAEMMTIDDAKAPRKGGEERKKKQEQVDSKARRLSSSSSSCHQIDEIFSPVWTDGRLPAVRMSSSWMRKRRKSERERAVAC